jgi:hypothetical protein
VGWIQVAFLNTKIGLHLVYKELLDQIINYQHLKVDPAI